MARKKKKSPGGAPDWLVTYGDMMTLLFCFFLILVSMSETKKDKKFEDFVESIRRAFGFKGGIGYIPGQALPNNTYDEKMTQVIVEKFLLQQGESTEEGIEGEKPSVRTIREGSEYTFGGQISFEPGKARLLDPVKIQLAEFAQEFRGLNTKIRIRGHAARKPPWQYSPYESLDDLSYQRALAVKGFLVGEGIRQERITVEACGDNEPLLARAYDEAGRAKNRRVDVIVTENLVEQYMGQTDTSKAEQIF
jgi:chemotaxis protein MotB